MASKTSPQALVEHALATTRSDDCVVIVQARTAANLRWAVNTLTTNGVMHGLDVTVISFARRADGVSTGSVTGSATTTAQVTALVANEHGIFGVYSMREVFEYTRFWAVGSGREFALGAMHAEYSRQKTAAAVATAGIEAGTTFDKNSGLPMTLYTVNVKH